MSKFNKVMEQNLEKLELYVPVVARVHGKTHPEFHEVKRIYDEIIKKYNKGEGEVSYISEFIELRKITNNYEVPGDVCESYEAVYNMMEELDKAYCINK